MLAKLFFNTLTDSVYVYVMINNFEFKEKLGVGGENTVKADEDWLPKLHVNSLRLHNFINNAGEVSI